MIYPYRCSDVLMIRYDLMFKLCFSYSETNNEEYEDDILANLCVFDFNVLQCYSSQINLKNIMCTAIAAFIRPFINVYTLHLKEPQISKIVHFTFKRTLDL